MLQHFISRSLSNDSLLSYSEGNKKKNSFRYLRFDVIIHLSLFLNNNLFISTF